MGCANLFANLVIGNLTCVTFCFFGSRQSCHCQSRRPHHKFTPFYDFMRAFYIPLICYLTLRQSIGMFVVAQGDKLNAKKGNDDRECVASESDATCTDCFDHDVSVCSERHFECDSDPSYMLVHCRKTCKVCQENTLSQNAGFGRVPSEVTMRVLQVARQTNLYYESLDIPDYALISCNDQSDMCAFWKSQGQCTSLGYREYMESECPLTCQHCELVQARAFVKFLLEDLKEAYNTHSDNLLASRKASLSLLMSTLGMDAKLIGKPLEFGEINWANELHARLHNVIPDALLRSYNSLDGPINDKDLSLLKQLHGFSPDASREIVLTNTLIQYRSRDYIVSIMQAMDHLITRPIQLLIGFAVPNDASIKRLQELPPLLQMGAGSGYWAGILRRDGINVLAYDLDPPSMGNNQFFDASYIDDIKEGGCVESMTPELAQDRALLLIWPNDADPIDNRNFCQDEACQGSQAIWDVECLEAFIRAGGRHVVYVGERASAISGDGSDSGLSATRRFQELLESDFILVDTIKIPNWWLNEDDMTIWKKIRVDATK